jgi:NAD(P)-dependent dehydrogenase (short-subunit alcohol dehydrogenase family)
MPETGSVLIIGGTSGIGREIARHYADRGRDVVITGRDAGRATAAAGEIGDRVQAIGLDLTQPEEIAERLSAIDRDRNSLREYDIEEARRLVTLKLIGYTEAIHALVPRLTAEGSIVLFGGLAKDRPYPGSTTVSTVNGAVTSMVRTFAVELAPIRVNAVHPGIVGDSPFWLGKEASLDAILARTPTGRLVSMDDVVGAVVFLLENPSLNGVNLPVDGGWLLL